MIRRRWHQAPRSLPAVAGFGAVLTASIPRTPHATACRGAGSQLGLVGGSRVPIAGTAGSSRSGANRQLPGRPSRPTLRFRATDAPLPPVISIAQPATDATVRGTATVSGTTTGGAGVTRGQVSVDNGPPMDAAGTSNWSAGVDTTALPDGTHTITVQATDANGTVGKGGVSVNVSNSTPGTSCATPAVGTIEVSGNLSLEADQAGWAGVVNGNSAVTRIAPAGGSYDGTWALQIGPKAAGAAGVNNVKPVWVPGPPGRATTTGQVYTASALVRATTVGEKVTLLVKESSPSGTSVGTRSTPLTLGDTNWHQISATYTAKATGNVLNYSLSVSNFTSTNQRLLGDCLSLQTR